MKKHTASAPSLVTSITAALNDPQAGTRQTDMGQARPASALVTGSHRSGCWKLLPYRCAEGAGTLICAPVAAEPRPVTLRLNARGRGHVFLGVWSHGRAAWRAKLTGDPCYRYVIGAACQIALHEIYFTTAELDGKELVFAAWPAKGTGTAVGLAWVRTVPAGAPEADLSPTAAVHATNDVTSWVGAANAMSLEDIHSSIEILRATDTGSISFDCGLFGERNRRWRDLPDDFVCSVPFLRHCRASLRKLTVRGDEVLGLYHDYTEKLGLQQDYYLRLQEFKFDEPRTEAWYNPFFEENPQWRCVFRDGRKTAQISYCFPEVRAHLLAGLERMLTPRIAGLTLACNRSGPCVLYEEPVCAAYREETGRDLRAEDETAMDTMRFRAGFFTQFLRECRETLDKAAARDGRARHLRAIVLADQMSNLYYGFDVEAWAREKLVDTLLVYPVYLDFSFAEQERKTARPWEQDYHPDRLKREARCAKARINREAVSKVIEWDFFENLRRQHGIKLYGGFKRVPSSAREFLEEVQNVYRHEVDGLLAWDAAHFIFDAGFRPLGEHLGRREWLLSLTPETIPSYTREIHLHDLGDIPVDLFGAQMSG